MIYTNEEIENNVAIFKQIFNIDTKNKVLKMFINLSLSKNIEKDIEISRKNGSEYKIQTIIGDDENIVKYKKILETLNNVKYSNKDFEKEIEYHIHRGNSFVNKLVSTQTNPFLFFKEILELNKVEA